MVWVGYAGTVPVNATEDFDLIVTFDAPDAPTPPVAAPTLTLDVVSDTQIDGTLGTLIDATGYEWTYEAGTQTGDPTTGTPVDLAALTTFEATGLTAETTYTFWVRGYNDDGDGPWSDPVVETTSAALLTFTYGFDTQPPTVDRLTSLPEWTDFLNTWLNVDHTNSRVRTSNSSTLVANKVDPTDTAFPADQWVEVDWVQMSTTLTARHLIVARASGTTGATTDTAYIGEWGDYSTGTWRLFKRVNGVETDLATGTLLPHALGTMRLECEGTTIRFWINGTLMATETDATIAAGQPGLGMYRSDAYAGELRAGAL